MLDRTVGIFDDVSIFLAQQAGRESQGQVAPLGLLLHACNQAAAQGVELDFAHDALHPEQQTAIGGRRIVDAIAVRNQTLIIPTTSLHLAFCLASLSVRKIRPVIALLHPRH